MALHRPWFQPEDRLLPLFLHLFGAGPEFFQYLYPLIHPPELSHLNIGPVYYEVLEARNSTLNRCVELGFFGLAGHLVLLGAVAVTGVRMIRDKDTAIQMSHRLVVAAIMAPVAGRTVEQLAGISHLSDESLFWILLAMVAALPRQTLGPSQGVTSSSRVQSSFGAPQFPATRVGAPVLQISLGLIVTSVVLGFAFVKNTNYALAKKRATAAASLVNGRPGMAMRSINSAIALAPDVGRYHTIRASILDQARSSAPVSGDQTMLTLEAYHANRRAVISNPFDIYGRLNFAESTLTLATLGQAEKGAEAIEEYRLLTSIQPRFWLSHFLLGLAYIEMGEPGRVVDAFSVAIRIDPSRALLFDRRAEAYGLLGEYRLAIEDYASMIQLNPNDAQAYIRKAIVLFASGRLEEAIQDFDQTIKLHDRSIEYLKKYDNFEEAAKINLDLAMAYNNRASAYYQLGRVDRAIEDYDRAIQLSPRTAEFYANRAFAYKLLNKGAEARRDIEQAKEMGFDPDSQRQD